MIKVFRTGSGTFIGSSFESGLAETKILQTGEGYYVGNGFPSIREAEEFCLSELKADPGAIFHLMNGDKVASTVLDREFHEKKEKQWRRTYGTWSFIFSA